MHLRAPSYPAVVPVGVLRGARPADDEDPVPREAQRLSEAAVEVGWQVMVTVASATGSKSRRAPAPEDDRKHRKWIMEPYDYEMITVAVRMLNPGLEMRVAIWKDGAFDCGLRLLPTGLIKVDAATVKDLSGSPDPDRGQHRPDD